MPEVFSAPLAIISVDGTRVGKARNIRGSESYRRGRVTGIGRMNPSEVPALEFTGNLTVGFYTINFSEHPLLRDAILRKTGSSEKMLNTMALQEIGMKLDILRKVVDRVNFPPDGRDPDGIIQHTTEVFATIEPAFITADNFDLNELQLSGRDSTFEYLNPINYLV